MNPIKLSYNLDISDKSSWLTVTAAPSVRTSFAFVQELGDFYCGAKYFTMRENLASYLIKLTVSGEGALEYENETYHIKPGRLFWVDCRKYQRYYTAPEVSHWHIIWVHLYGPTAQAYYEAFLEQNNGSVMVSTDYPASFLDIFSQLFDLYRGRSNTMQDDIQASCLLTQLMTGCIQLAGQKGSARQKPEYVSAIQEYIDSHYHEDITLDGLAQHFSINKYYLSIIKSLVSKTIDAYFESKRNGSVDKYCDLLASPGACMEDKNDHMIEFFDENFAYEKLSEDERYRIELIADGMQTDVMIKNKIQQLMEHAEFKDLNNCTWKNVGAALKEALVGSESIIMKLRRDGQNNPVKDDRGELVFDEVTDEKGKQVVRKLTAEDIEEIGKPYYVMLYGED